MARTEHFFNYNDVYFIFQGFNYMLITTKNLANFKEVNNTSKQRRICILEEFPRTSVTQCREKVLILLFCIPSKADLSET